MIRGGVLWFYPPEQTFFLSQAKEHAIFPLHITPLFCQFCKDLVLQFAEQTIFLTFFAEQFGFTKKTP